MTTQSVTLTGDALAGIDGTQQGFASLPETVKLGRVRGRHPRAVPHLGDHFDPEGAVAPPPSTDRRAKAQASLSRMYVNDSLGCCVISGKAHALGLWGGNDTDSGGVVLASDQEIVSQYDRWKAGPGDSGCVITDVLDAMRASGFTAGGKLYPLEGYAAADWTDRLLTQVVIDLFGACCVGINLPEAWTTAAVWDVTNTPVVGGHDVTPVDYDEKGVYVSSWGRVYLMTWAAWRSTRWIDEFYALLAPLWYGSDRLAPSGVDAAALRADLAMLDRHQTPPLPDPAPPGPAPPPPAPTPPAPLFTMSFGRAVRKGDAVSFRAPVALPAGAYGVSPLAHGPHAAAQIEAAPETPKPRRKKS